VTRKRGEATALTLNCCLSETMTAFPSVSTSKSSGHGRLRVDLTKSLHTTTSSGPRLHPLMMCPRSVL
jgi:hypothetical protein